jgi:hypothetical protein
LNIIIYSVAVAQPTGPWAGPLWVPFCSPQADQRYATAAALLIEARHTDVAVARGGMA